MRIDLNVYLHSDGDDAVASGHKILSKLTDILTAVRPLEIIMADLQDFVTQQTAFNASLNTALTDIGADIDSLNAKIEALVAAQGSLSAEQQAALDALVAEGSALGAKADALNALTPPALPPAA